MAEMTYARIHAMHVHKRGRARPRPFPYHATLDKVGLVLGAATRRGQPGISTEKPEDQSNVAPTDFGENAQNPIFGRTATWRTFHLGMGLSVEDEDPARAEGRYRWGINADASVASRLAMQGPQITILTPTSPDPHGIRKFFELKGKLYWLNGQYLYRIDSDTSATRVGDFGASHLSTDVVVFASNGLAGVTYAYIAVMDYATVPPAAMPPSAPGSPPPDPADFTEEGSALPFYRFDGTTLTQHATITASHFCVLGRNFYRANNRNQISSVDVDTDPWLDANWKAENQFLIGDKTSPITALIETAVGTLLVPKTDGIYSIDENGEYIRYFPFLKFGRSNENGRTWGSFMNDIYIRYGESLYKVTPDLQIEEVGPNRYGTVDGPVKGRTTAFAGHANFHGYTGLWNPDFDTAFLLKYGSHQVDEKGQPQRIEAWHGSISVPFQGDRITSLFVSGWGAPVNHNRMYIGFRSGKVGVFILPCVPDAGACEEYRFSVADGWVVFPNWHAGFPSSDKPLRYAAVGGDNLNAQNYATLEYRLDPVSADAALGMPWLLLSGNFDTLPSERIEFPDQTKGKAVALKLVLHCTDPTSSPLITSVSLRWRLTTDFQQVYSMIVLAEDGLVTRDGTPLRRGAQRIRGHVRDIARTNQIVELVLPDEEIKLVSIIDYSETIGWWERTEKWVAALKVSFAEDATGATYGTYGRLRALKYGDLRGMVYGDLRTL